MRTAFSVRQRDGVTKNACKDVVEAGLSIAEMGQCASASGQTRNGLPVEPTHLQEYVNDVDNWAARNLVSAWVPLPGGEEVDALLEISGGQNNSLATQYQHTGLSTIDQAQTYRTTLPNGQPAIDNFSYREERTAGDNFPASTTESVRKISICSERR